MLLGLRDAHRGGIPSAVPAPIPHRPPPLTSDVLITVTHVYDYMYVSPNPGPTIVILIFQCRPSWMPALWCEYRVAKCMHMPAC